jgi:hypothetical protein
LQNCEKIHFYSLSHHSLWYFDMANKHTNIEQEERKEKKKRKKEKLFNGV